MKLKSLNKIEVYYRYVYGKRKIKGKLQDEGLNWIFIPEHGGSVIYNPSVDNLFINKEEV